MPFVKPPEVSCHSFLLKGRSGGGKTHVFRDLIEAGYSGVYATTENKYATIADLLTPENFYVIKDAFFPLNASEKANVGRPSDLIKLYDQLRAPAHPFDFLFVDSGMFYLEELLAYIEGVMGLIYPANFGDFSKRAEKFFKTTTGLVSPQYPKPVDVFVTWGVERDIDWQGKRTTQPIMDGKRTKPKIDFYFDHVVYLESRAVVEGTGKEFVAHTQGTDEFEAKISSPLTFDPVIVDPDFGAILKRLKSAPKLPTDLVEGVKDALIDHDNEAEGNGGKKKKGA